LFQSADHKIIAFSDDPGEAAFDLKSSFIRSAS
jgi:hypothetical protein